MRARTLLVFLLAACGLALAPRASGAQSDPLAAVRIGISVAPDSVTVGDPLELRIRVSAPAGAAIAFPEAPDSTGPVQAIGTRNVSRPAAQGPLDQTAIYKLAAWDIGDLPVRMGDIVVTLGSAERRIPLGDITVRAVTVLPADTTLRVPKPPRPPLDVNVPWWKRWWPLLAALAVLALLAWWWWRRRRRRPAGAGVMDAHAFAEREFTRIEALGLVEAGERGRYVALMVEVLRDYLALRVPDARASLTTGELLFALRQSPVVPTARLGPLLGEADLVKFARRSVTVDQARELGREARAIARDVEKSLTAESAATTVKDRKAAA